jgi:tRNA (uracil-5-)-methyltransferase
MPLPVVDPARYEAQLAAKVAALRDQFAALQPPEPEVFRSEPSHYRLRAEFRIWKDAGRLDYVMFDPADPRVPIRLHEFPVAARNINAAMPRVLAAVQADEILRHRLFQIEYLATLSGDLLVTLIYHKALDDSWRAAAQRMREQLGIDLIGRSKGKKILLDRDWVQETLSVRNACGEDRDWHYRQIEGSFTQPNGGTNQHMLNWACVQVSGASSQGGDLLELYCGNGNFTLPLSLHFEKVLATEVSKTSVAAALHNIALNGVGNVALARLSSDEISTALSGGRAFRRLRDIDLDSYRFSTLLVDPPRMGLDPATLQFAARFDRVLYISCNPHTLRDNMETLRQTHTIASFAAFDQFPYTDHLECGVLLTRR